MLTVIFTLLTLLVLIILSISAQAVEFVGKGLSHEYSNSNNTYEVRILTASALSFGFSIIWLSWQTTVSELIIRSGGFCNIIFNNEEKQI